MARQKKLPLLDIYAEMENRNKNIFEFLDADGVHLTWKPPKGRPTKRSFLRSGYLLRGYLTVRKGMEVKKKVFDILANEQATKQLDDQTIFRIQASRRRRKPVKLTSDMNAIS